MKNTEKYLEDFNAHMTLKNFRPATRKAYASALCQFFKYRDREGMTGPLNQEEARKYILYRYQQGKKWQTINGDYSAMHKLFREVLDLPWDIKKLPRPRKERSLPKILSQKEVIQIIEAGTIFKHQVFMAFLYGSGLRLSEALNLYITDIDGERKQIRVEKGKGAKDRYVIIPECLLLLLRQYYRMYHPIKYLFNGQRPGSQFSIRGAQAAIAEARIEAGITRRASAHTFRHCYATHHLENGTDIVYLQQQLGHKHLKTTARYIHLCREQFHRINHPLANMAINFNPKRV